MSSHHGWCQHQVLLCLKGSKNTKFRVKALFAQYQVVPRNMHALIVPLMVKGESEQILILRNKDEAFVGAINGAFTHSRFQEAILPPP